MKLPGLAIALLAVALPACTCSRSDAPAPAPAPIETPQVQAASEAAPASSAASRLVFQRVEKKKRPMKERMEEYRHLFTDAGAPIRMNSKLNCGPTSAKADAADAASQ